MSLAPAALADLVIAALAVLFAAGGYLPVDLATWRTGWRTSFTDATPVLVLTCSIIDIAPGSPRTAAPCGWTRLVRERSPSARKRIPASAPGPSPRRKAQASGALFGSVLSVLRLRRR